MRLRNNNQAVLRLLANATYKNSQTRNRILILAVALSVIIIFSICSIAVGRIEAECLIATRERGTIASTILEDATLEQAKQVDSLPYIDAVGMEYIFGLGFAEVYSDYFAVYVDETAYQEFLTPAYTDIFGRYPEQENEVMLPVRTLNGLGIEKPQIGQTVTLTMELDSGAHVTEEFLLSGYYTEYMAACEKPFGFFSQAYYESLGNSLEQATGLEIIQKKTMSGEEVEKRLYEDVDTIDIAQQFIGANRLDYNAVEAMLGGYDMAVAAACLVFLCVSLLIYNVMHISLQRDIRGYGLMKTLGTTKGQITGIVLYQLRRIVIRGIIIGTGVAVVLVLLFIPKLLENLYMDSYGKASAMLGFRWQLLLLAILVSAMVALMSAMIPVGKVGKMAPVDALRYLGGKETGRKKDKHSVNGSRIYQMAWRNVFRNKRNAILTLLSLSLGLIVAMGAIVITKGMDGRNQIEAEDDFTLYSLEGPINTPEYDDGYVTFEEELVEKIGSINGVAEMKVSRGGYVRLDSNDEAWNPLLAANRLLEGMQDTDAEIEVAAQQRQNYLAGITILNEEQIAVLEKCNEKYQLSLDMESVKSGTGFLALHFNELSQKLTKKSKTLVGRECAVSNLAGDKIGSLRLAGYLNRYQKGIPEIGTAMWSMGMPYLIMSEEAFERLGLEKKVLQIAVNVESQREPLIKSRLFEMIDEMNKEPKKSYMSGPLYSVYSKSDMLAAAHQRLLAIRILMYGISGLLVLMGLFNYLNITIVSLNVRRKEFAVLESIGMTVRQLKQMLLLEGVYYAVLVSITLLMAGSVMIWGLYQILKSRIYYIRFYYPYLELFVICSILCVICFAMPVLLYQKFVEKSTVERLRENVD